MEVRKPNTECFVCKKPIYRRPFELEKCTNVFCSKKCFFSTRNLLLIIPCKFCNKDFRQTTRKQKYCSKSCSSSATRNRTGTKKGIRTYKHATQKYLFVLMDVFDFQCCMIDGCTYNITYDVHRLIPGKDGGKYEIGNMFAICPNHHAEIHRNIIKVEKVSDCKLRKVAE